MKIRTDFVTNSSSSSFVIAVKVGLVGNDLKNELLKNKKQLKSFLKNNEEYWEGYEWNDDINEIKAAQTQEEKIEIMADKIANEIYQSTKDGLRLGEWLAYAVEASSEEVDLYDNWLMDASFDTENLKIKAFD